MQLTNCANSGGFRLPSQPRFPLLQPVEVRIPFDDTETSDVGVVTGYALEEGKWMYQVTFPHGCPSSPWLPTGWSDWASEDEIWVR